MAPIRASWRVLAGVLAVLWAGAASAPGCKKPEPKTRAVGDGLKSFIVKSTETGQQYCQVCAYAGKPILMAVADAADATFEADLVRMQAIVDANAAKGLRAFAVLGVIKDGRLSSMPDEAAAVARIEAARKRLGIRFPLTVLPEKLSAEEQRNYAGFNDGYELAGSRMVMLANAANEVVFAEVIRPAEAEQQFRKLEDVAKALE